MVVITIFGILKLVKLINTYYAVQELELILSKLVLFFQKKKDNYGPFAYSKNNLFKKLQIPDNLKYLRND